MVVNMGCCYIVVVGQIKIYVWNFETLKRNLDNDLGYRGSSMVDSVDQGEAGE